AYVLSTPWFFYWYLLGPLVLVAVLPTNRLTYPILTFSATSLFALNFPSSPPWWILQAVLRYGPPILVFALYRPRPSPVAAREDERAGTVVPLPMRTGAIVPGAAPAAK